MVEIDYILDADALRNECRYQDLLSDYTLPEWEMLMRLRVGEVEVFGHTEEEYQRWMANIESNKLSLHVPSSAWSFLAVLSVAVSVDSAFDRLREDGRSDIDVIEGVILMERQDNIAMIYIDRDRVGQASVEEMYSAFASFAGRVRDDFLSICPQLRDHVTLGPWFKGHAKSAIVEEPRNVIYLPPISS